MQTKLLLSLEKGVLRSLTRGFIVLGLVSIAINGFQPHSCAAQIVRVGGYEFPPFLMKKNNRLVGITSDLLEILNTFQKAYTFQLIPTTALKRYQDYKNKQFDLLFFESIHWGWQAYDVTSSMVFLKGGERYITRTEKGKTHAYFDDFKGKSILGYLGYHYGFAHFNADRNYLQEHFNIKLTTSHAGNIQAIIEGKADIAVITQSYLSMFLKDLPGMGKKILISRKLDQEYNHTILIRKNDSPSVVEINRMLVWMGRKGLLDELWRKYGIHSDIVY